MIFLLWIFFFLISAGEAFISAFYLLSYTDFEEDEMGSLEMSSKINPMIKIEYIAQAVVTVLCLLFGQWVPLFLNLPLFAYHAHRFQTKKYLLDATELFKQIKRLKREAIVKLGVYTLFFFFYFYCMIRDIIRYALDSDDLEAIADKFKGMY